MGVWKDRKNLVLIKFMVSSSDVLLLGEALGKMDMEHCSLYDFLSFNIQTCS